MQSLEQKITDLEAQKLDIETRLAGAGTDYVAAQKLAEELQSTNAALDTAISRWTDLAERE